MRREGDNAPAAEVMKLMNILAPAINNGQVKVEVMGPLFS
jgi:hypothetical protein